MLTIKWSSWTFDSQQNHWSRGIDEDEKWLHKYMGNQWAQPSPTHQWSRLADRVISI